MGAEAAFIAAIVAAGATGSVLLANTNKPSKPDVVPQVQTKTDAPEAKRQEVYQQMAKLRKQTLLAKRDEPEPLIKKTVLGAGI